MLEWLWLREFTLKLIGQERTKQSAAAQILWLTERGSTQSMRDGTVCKYIHWCMHWEALPRTYTAENCSEK